MKDCNLISKTSRWTGRFLVFRNVRQLALFLCLGVSTVCLSAELTPRKESVASPFAGQFVPERELPILERQALLGSAEAAFRLQTHYDWALDYSKSIFWGTLAAENGNQVGAYNLGYRLSESPDPKQRLRARFWLESAKNRGGEAGVLAASLLERILAQEKSHAAPPVVMPEKYPKW